MSTLFGYRIDPDFDLAKEQRRDRVGWVMWAGVALAMAYDLSGGRFGVEAFQGVVATSLFYGASFYADRRNALGKLWLWEIIFATVPLHVIYLAVLFWTDIRFPDVMTKAFVFIPVLSLCFAIESILVDRIVAWRAARS
jgi:hypothetical protein